MKKFSVNKFFTILIVPIILCTSALAEHPCEVSIKKLKENGTQVYSSDPAIAQIYCAVGFDFESRSAANTPASTLVAAKSDFRTHKMMGFPKNNFEWWGKSTQGSAYSAWHWVGWIVAELAWEGLFYAYDKITETREPEVTIVDRNSVAGIIITQTEPGHVYEIDAGDGDGLTVEVYEQTK